MKSFSRVHPESCGLKLTSHEPGINLMAIYIGINSFNNPTPITVTIVVDSYNATPFYFTGPKDDITDYEVEEVITVDIDEVKFPRFKVFKGIHAVHLVKGDIEGL